MADDAAAPSGELSKPATEPAEPATDSVDAEEESGAEFLDEAEAEDDPEPDLEPDDATPRISHVRLASIVGLVVVLALGGLVGWLGFRAYQSHQLDAQRKVFLQVGRQGALNLTTIDYQHVDEDVKRILDSATGTFYDDFQQRAQPFTDVVKQVKSKSVGSVTEAGLESESENEAQVLVAVAVNTTVEGQPNQQPRAWRMRILVQKVGEDTKVSNVEFVP
ncbi:MAG: Mce-associated rane protein [Mycobacterium sp.]|jgi:Mce-associated membrane protein|nr:Mce-associated rane protein [Mycobacterium sp.]MDT5195116.1 Mce-associated rane protein [Mycobacterium sp.]MDT5298987.1 Mce-associated rane protein [Mycobacterium sp.]MDT5359959.1 Mce-associated rane protein [Mycobacterium sp.]